MVATGVQDILHLVFPSRLIREWVVVGPLPALGWRHDGSNLVLPNRITTQDCFEVSVFDGWVMCCCSALPTCHSGRRGGTRLSELRPVIDPAPRRPHLQKS